MKLRQLQFFETVARTRSFSRAAEICHATQPTLSNAIGQLEAELGGKLFERTTRQVDLTPFGRHMLPRIREALAAAGEVEQAASAYHNPTHRLLRVGVSPLVDAKLLDRALDAFRDAHPDTGIFFKECLLEDIDQRLRDEVVDIAIVPSGLMGDGFECCAFYSDELFYLPRSGDNLEGLQLPLRVGGLPRAPVIVTGGRCGLDGSLDRLFASQGHRLERYPGHALSYQMIADWTDVGIGAGILPRAKVQDRISPSPIPLYMNDGRPAVISYEWIWRAGQQGNPEMPDLIDYIRTDVPQNMPCSA